MKEPLVSIITVCYNSQDTIESTINSIAKQDYPNIDYIIVDGDSTDITKQIIRQHSDTVSQFVSQKDKGLYYAMNTGLDMARGEYVWFINSGDIIPHSNTLSSIMHSSYLKQDIYYGQTKIIDQNGKTIGARRLKPPQRLNKNSFLWGMVVCHQAAIVRKSITRHYNTKYKITADYDWLLSAIERADPELMRYSSATYCKFLQGGISSKKMNLANKERYQIMIKHYGFVKASFFNFLMLFRFIKSKMKGEL